MIRSAIAIMSIITVGCGAEFVPASVIVNERVIAITAEPPEATPGEQVTLTPLVVSPTGELVVDETFRATWWRCPREDSDALGDFVQCTDPSELEVVGSSAPYVDTVPLDIFGELPPPGQQPTEPPAQLPSDKLLGAVLGYWRVVGMTMDTVAPGRSVDAFKRIPVYLPVRLGDLDERLANLDSHVNEDGVVLPPNSNPLISAVTIHEGSRDGATTTSLSSVGKFFFKPIFSDDALEEYISLKVDLAGLDVTNPETLRDVPVDDLIARFAKVQRCEIPTFSWFVTHGRVRRDTTIDEGVIARHFDALGVDCPPVEGDARFPEVEYTPPTGEADDPRPEDGVVHGWVVMRDGRGGTAVRAFDFTLD